MYFDADGMTTELIPIRIISNITKAIISFIFYPVINVIAPSEGAHPENYD
jgi:hypothetical protein